MGVSLGARVCVCVCVSGRECGCECVCGCFYLSCVLTVPTSSWTFLLILSPWRFLGRSDLHIHFHSSHNINFDSSIINNSNISIDSYFKHFWTEIRDDWFSCRSLLTFFPKIHSAQKNLKIFFQFFAVVEFLAKLRRILARKLSWTTHWLLNPSLWHSGRLQKTTIEGLWVWIPARFSAFLYDAIVSAIICFVSLKSFLAVL